MRRTVTVLVTLALASVVGAETTASRVEPRTCQVATLLDEVRSGLRTGSPAYRRYLGRLLRDQALNLSEAELIASFARETDPAVLEVLGAALAARTDGTGEPAALRKVVERAGTDSDPARRAAAVRALNRTSVLEHAPEAYNRLVDDPAPEVRAAAAQNIVDDHRDVYGGVHQAATDAAAGAALVARDPATTASILGGLRLMTANASVTSSIARLLDSPNAGVRAAAAIALGGAPGSEAPALRTALLERYPTESESVVRSAFLQALAQLGRASAIPDLLELRAIDSTLTSEIDEWVRVLGLGLQEWSLIQRERTGK